MTDRISILAPSRGRPEAFAAMVRSAFDTAADPAALEVCTYLDLDDPTRADYAIGEPAGPLPVRAVVGGPRDMSDLWNAAADLATGEVLMLGADDLRFRTRGWDAMVRAEFGRWPDRLVVVWGQDGNLNGQRCTHPFVHRRWVEVTGHFTPNNFVADYADHWIYDVGMRVGRVAEVPGMLIEHMHVSLGKSPMDDTERRKVERMNVPGQRPVDRWGPSEPEREAEAERIRAVIG